jgi:hypothetical protein
MNIKGSIFDNLRHVPGSFEDSADLQSQSGTLAGIVVVF